MSQRRLLPALLLPSLLLPLACPDEVAPKPNGTKAEGKQAEGAAPTGMPKLTPSSDDAEPQMADRVGKPSYPPAPDAPERFSAGWQLAPGKKREYLYTQEALASSLFSADTLSQHLEVKGILVVDPKAEGRADVVLRDGRTKMSAEQPGGEPRVSEQKLPPRTYAELLRTDAPPSDPEDPLVLAMLSVPKSPLAVGEQADEPLRMPFNTNGSKLWATGTLRSTLVGFVQCGKATCAHLARELTLTDIDVPEGTPGTYGVRARSHGWTLFDLDDGSVLQHKSATHIRLSADVPAPEGGAASQPAGPTKMNMRQEHLHEILRQ